MSDTVRTYEGRRHATGTGHRSVFSVVRWALALFVLLFMGYGCWVVRDSVPLRRMIPAGQKYNITALDLLNNRSKIANSPLWDALPASMGLGGVPDALTRTLGLPDWALNNLIGDRCYVSGNDVRGFTDVVFVTKMRPIGAMLERTHWFSPEIERDYAGGLDLRRMAKAGVFYAVRGRVLLVSPSRDALIRALTLREQDSMEAAPLSGEDSASETGAEDLRGSITLSAGDPLGGVFNAIRFAVRMDTPDSLLKCRAALSPDAKQRFATLLEHVTPRPLLAPPEGLVEISGNLGQSIRNVVTEFGNAAPTPYVSTSAWERWEAGPTEGAAAEQVLPRLAQMLTNVIGPAGPAFRLALHGIDANEIIPAPEVVGVFEGDGIDVSRTLENACPPPPPTSQAWESYPRYDAGAKALSLPLPFGGPSMAPTAVPWGADVLVSSSRTVAMQLASQPPVPVLLPHQGNLFVRIQPAKCVEAVADALRLLADAGALRGYTPDSLEADITQWTRQAGLIQGFWALASYQDPDITLDIQVSSAPSGV